MPTKIVRNGWCITLVNNSTMDANIIIMPSVISIIVSEIFIVLILNSCLLYLIHNEQCSHCQPLKYMILNIGYIDLQTLLSIPGKHYPHYKADIAAGSARFILVGWCWIFTKLAQTNTHCFARHCIAVNAAYHVAMRGPCKTALHPKPRTTLHMC